MPTTVTASLPRELFDWVTAFEKDSGLSRKDILITAVKCYRASNGPELALLKAQVRKLQARAILSDAQAKTKT